MPARKSRSGKKEKVWKTRVTQSIPDLTEQWCSTIQSSYNVGGMRIAQRQANGLIDRMNASYDLSKKEKGSIEKSVRAFLEELGNKDAE